MIFRESYRPRIKNTAVSGGWDDLLSWLNIQDASDITGKRSLTEITVYTCIKILAETLGKLPLKIYQDVGGKRVATNHYLYPLLKLRPNPYMSSTDFWKCMETMRNVYGNAYAYIEVNRNGRITGLYPLDSSRMKIYVDNEGLLSSVQSIWYIYTDATGIQHKLIADELLHFKGLSTDGIAGMNPIETLKMTIENAKSSSTFLNNAYKTGMTTSGIVNYIGDLNEEAKETFRTNFESMAAGLSNTNRISMLPVGYQYQPIAMKLTDAQFLENARFTGQQLTAAFGIKPHQVNDQTKTSYASASEANREFHTDTLLAILTGYEQEMDWKLFLQSEIDQSYYVKFSADVILRADMKTRFDSYMVGIQNGFKTPNECRALEEDESKPGGDDLIVNGTMVKLADVGAAYKKGGNE